MEQLVTDELQSDLIAVCSVGPVRSRVLHRGQLVVDLHVDRVGGPVVTLLDVDEAHHDTTEGAGRLDHRLSGERAASLCTVSISNGRLMVPLSVHHRSRLFPDEGRVLGGEHMDGLTGHLNGRG